MSADNTIGFIGLGVMGRPMAAHLIKAGHTVIVHNRSKPAVDELVAAGARAAVSPADVAAQANSVITMLPDSPDVEAVLLGAQGVATAARPGTLVVDCSTISPQAAVSVGARMVQRGLRFVDAPVSGGETGALAGELAIMMGGDAPDVRAATSLVDPFASVVAHVGPTGSGQTVKAANQMIVAGNIAVLGEALSVLRRTPVDVDAALKVLNGGLAASRVLQVKAPKMLAHDFTPGFRLDLHHKDLQFALAAAEQANIAVPVTALVAQFVVALRAAGDGGLDHAALIKATERLSSTHSQEGTSCQ